MSKQLVFFCLLFCLWSCSESKVHSDVKTEKTNTIKFAQTLDILENKDNILIHIKNPENNEVSKYFLSRSATSKIPNGYTFIHIPVKSIIPLSSTHIGMLSKIDGISTIKAVSDKKYIYNPQLLKRISSGQVKDFGGDAAIPFESIVQTKAKLLVYSSFGKVYPQQEQLEKLGTICLPNFDWKENHPLGKAEWIKLFGYLLGKEEKAQDYFKQLEIEYNALKNTAKKSIHSPTIFSGNLTGDIWFTPAGQSYTAELFKDANANYKYANSLGTGSLELSMEKVLSENTTTEFWINPGQQSCAKIIEINGKMKYFKAVKDKKVFCYSPNMNKFWELSAIEPQRVLSDLIRILHRDIKMNNTLYFYKNICK